jgi:hypothetical protein
MRFTIFKRLAIGYAAIMILVILMGVYVTLKLIQINRLTRDAAHRSSKKSATDPPRHTQTFYPEDVYRTRTVIARRLDLKGIITRKHNI